MTGYRRERRTYILEFADPEYEGLEIKVRSIPIRDLMHLLKLDPESEDATVRADSITQLMSAFAEALVSWNMEDDKGQALPTTLEYLESEDTDFVMSLIAQWMKAISRVDDASPLDERSASGPPTLEKSPSPLS